MQGRRFVVFPAAAEQAGTEVLRTGFRLGAGRSAAAAGGRTARVRPGRGRRNLAHARRHTRLNAELRNARTVARSVDIRTFDLIRPQTPAPPARLLLLGPRPRCFPSRMHARACIPRARAFGFKQKGGEARSGAGGRAGQQMPRKYTAVGMRAVSDSGDSFSRAPASVGRVSTHARPHSASSGRRGCFGAPAEGGNTCPARRPSV